MSSSLLPKSGVLRTVHQTPSLLQGAEPAFALQHWELVLKPQNLEEKEPLGSAFNFTSRILRSTSDNFHPIFLLNMGFKKCLSRYWSCSMRLLFCVFAVFKMDPRFPVSTENIFLNPRWILETAEC